MKINYRPEIDGLRAIAVIAVITYHAKITIFNSELFKGGFIGVDIFFVISGYLITSIILKELVDTGKFSFKHFYQRRIRRILPALLLVMLVSIPFAWIYLMPSSLIGFSKSIFYSLGFSSNYYFWDSGQQYGAISGLLKPFLHTWSLSVEEQYYILFPIILLFAFKYFRKYLHFILILSFVASLGFADWSSRNYSSFNFYFLPTRVWELLAGSILAYFEIRLGHRSRNQSLNLILPGIGILLIGHSILFFNDKIFHPSFYSLSPIVGVSFIIWFSHKDELITKILSSKLFVGIGLISYSLYLWHYPVFAFSRITAYTQGSVFRAILLGLIILILSITSYYFIEKPARNKESSFKKIFIILLISIFIISSLNLITILQKGFETRFYVSDTYQFSKLKYEKENRYFEKNYDYDNYNLRKNVLIVGNSHAEDILEILSSTSLKDKIYFNLASPKIRNEDYNFQIEKFFNFLKGNKKSVDSINNNKDFLNHLIKQYSNADLIILGTRYDNADLNILDELIRLLKLDNKKIMIFNNALSQSERLSYKLNRLDYYVFKNKKFPNKRELKEIEQNMFEDLKRKKDVNLRIREITTRNNVYLIEREKIFCDIINKRCPAITDEGYKVYWDYGHITHKGAKFFAKKFEKSKLFLKYLNTALDISVD